MKLIAVAGLPFALLYQAGTGDSGFDLGQALQQLGVGAILLVPAYIAMRWLLARLNAVEDRATAREDALQAKIDLLQQEKVDLVSAARDRERELADSMSPLLTKLGEVVHDAPEVIDKALTKAKDTEERQTTDKRMRSIEMAVDALLKSREK